MNTERLNELKQEVSTEFGKHDVFEGYVGLYRTKRDLTALIDAEIARQTVPDEAAIIQTCYNKLLGAIGYAESIENTPDYKTALDYLREYALQAYKPSVTIVSDNESLCKICANVNCKDRARNLMMTHCSEYGIPD